MSLNYRLMDPTGNKTILVETPVAVEEQPSVAARLMEAEPSAEQVGFLGEAEDAACAVALRMAGGEFCGNAAMSAAVLAAERADVPEGTVLVEASGADRPVAVTYCRQPDGAYRATVDMPAPLAVAEAALPVSGTEETLRLPLVQMPGISHLLYEHPAPADDLARKAAERLVKEWCDALGAEALGLLFFEREASRLTPLVYVPAAGTLCWENACGSGSCAVGAYLAAEEGTPLHLALRQPGGTLEVNVSEEGALTLTGTVRIEQ